MRGSRAMRFSGGIRTGIGVAGTAFARVPAGTLIPLPINQQPLPHPATDP
jgi:hypothetical protein